MPLSRTLPGSAPGPRLSRAKLSIGAIAAWSLPRRKVLRLDPGANAALGLAGEITAREWETVCRDHIHPEDRPMLEKALETCACQTGLPLRLECRIRPENSRGMAQDLCFRLLRRGGPRRASRAFRRGTGLV